MSELQHKHACPLCGWEGGMIPIQTGPDQWIKVEFGCGHTLYGEEAQAWMEDPT